MLTSQTFALSVAVDRLALVITGTLSFLPPTLLSSLQCIAGKVKIVVSSLSVPLLFSENMLVVSINATLASDEPLLLVLTVSKISFIKISITRSDYRI